VRPTLNRNHALLVTRPTVRLFPVFAILFLTSFMAATTEAKETCPWINDQTAAGFLGGDVTSHVTFAIKDKSDPNFSNVDKNDAVCEFVHHQGSTAIALRIDVETIAGPPSSFSTYAARCGPHSVPVPAIGNEAVACDFENKSKTISEQVISRVRDHAFTVRITATVGSFDKEVLRQKARNVAEQVAGFLF
jgi:hypothetical protein